MKKTLNFSDWREKNNSVDESISDDIQNFLSRSFGGKVKKIDNIISDLESTEREYIKEWEKTQMDIISTKAKMEEEDISGKEESDLRKKLKEYSNFLDILLRRKNQKIKSLNNQAYAITQNNSRLKKYWDLKKSEFEVQIAEEKYNLAKKFPDRRIQDDLYLEYKKLYDKYQEREKESRKIKIDLENESEEEDLPVKKSKKSGMGEIIRMSLSQFKKEVKGYSPSEVKTLRKNLIEIKNDSLNELRSVKRAKSRELDSASNSKERTKISSDFNPVIYDLGEYIDRIREKINHIND
jgi:hypothetical protein